jgi:AcrR family transcriptional regulator
MTTKLAQGGILAAAIEVFAKLGFAAVRVEDILGAAGIARRTFYKYFQSKEDLLASIYELATSELLKEIRTVAAVNDDPVKALRRGLDAYLDYHVENGPLLRILVEQAMRSDSPLFQARRRFREDLIRFLDEAAKKSRRESHDPLLYAALLSALEGISLELLTKSAGREDVARAKRVMHLMLTRVLGLES